MLKLLTIRTPDGRTVATLEWNGVETRLVQSSQHIEGDLRRWLSSGLDEWVGTGLSAVPRSTSSTSPDFIDRLEGYLCRQFDFVTSKDTRYEVETVVFVRRAEHRLRCGMFPIPAAVAYVAPTSWVLSPKPSSTGPVSEKIPRTTCRYVRATVSQADVLQNNVLGRESHA